MTITTTTL